LLTLAMGGLEKLILSHDGSKPELGCVTRFESLP
jgi:hypothetical protein